MGSIRLAGPRSLCLALLAVGGLAVANPETGSQDSAPAPRFRIERRLADSGASDSRFDIDARLTPEPREGVSRFGIKAAQATAADCAVSNALFSDGFEGP